MSTLGDAEIGSTVNVISVSGEKALKRRLMDMGITKGCEIRMLNVAPLGDPIEIQVRGYKLTLRRKDAENIEVE